VTESDEMRAYRVRLGRGGASAEQALSEGWVGTDWLQGVDLTGQFPDDWRAFNQRYRDVVRERGEVSSMVAAGLACAATWTLGHAIQTGDLIISPDASGTLHLGRVTGPYEFAAGQQLPHRRPVTWLNQTFTKQDITEEFWKSIRGPFSVITIEGYEKELAELVQPTGTSLKVDGIEMEDAYGFVLEKHLEDFLVEHWDRTTIGMTHDILIQEGEVVGRGLQTDTGPADIVAQSKDGTEMLVIELKRGRASDAVVGQILRYMSFVQDLDESKSVRGLIVALEEDERLHRALAMVPNVSFMRYQLHFSLASD
jgi:restriction system protein